MGVQGVNEVHGVHEVNEVQGVHEVYGVHGIFRGGRAIKTCLFRLWIKTK